MAQTDNASNLQVTGPVIGNIYNVGTLDSIDENLRSIRGNGPSWAPDRDVLLDARHDLTSGSE